MKITETIFNYSAFHAGILIARLWLGAIMLKHSSSYLFGEKIGQFADLLKELGFPAPEFMAYLSQGTEFATAILIILGLRLGALILTLNMAIAVLFAHNLLIFTEGEMAFNYFILALIIALTGTGRYGLDQVILNKVIRAKQ